MVKVIPKRGWVRRLEIEMGAGALERVIKVMFEQRPA